MRLRNQIKPQVGGTDGVRFRHDQVPALVELGCGVGKREGDEQAQQGEDGTFDGPCASFAGLSLPRKAPGADAPSNR
ncbi:MAG: hypothetical protein N838_35855 [Thiohalocapsa sp. PB-PSB1]|nr:MAG: hypothetical protein N838_35855 [Thiohalocapsa sp. PB-PSB1]